MGFHKLIYELKEKGSVQCAVKALEQFVPVMDYIKINHKDKFEDILKNIHCAIDGPHYNEHFAERDVKEMYHTSKDGKKHYGEYFTYEDAEKIDKQYNIPVKHNIWDLYVALNATYHDYIKTIQDEMESKHTQEEEYERRNRGRERDRDKDRDERWSNRRDKNDDDNWESRKDKYNKMKEHHERGGKYHSAYHNDIDEKIIKKAIVFYFKDEDAPEGKVWKYIEAMDDDDDNDKSYNSKRSRY